jgi:predicted ATPase
MLMIQRLEIENFRGIEYADLRFTQVNALIAENGAGKTSCMAAIARLIPALRGESRLFLDGDFRVGLTETPRITLRFQVRVAIEGGDYEECVVTIESKRAAIGGSKSHLNSQMPAPFEIQFSGSGRAIEKLKVHEYRKGAQRVVRSTWSGGRICPIDLNSSDLEAHAATSEHEDMGTADAFRARVVAVRNRTAQAKQVAKRYPDLEERVLGNLSFYLPSDPFEAFQIEESSHQPVAIKRSGITTSFDCLSTGEVALVGAAMAREFISRNPFCYLVYMEEPEAGLHASAQVQLAKGLMDDLAEQQVFLSTHSPFILDALPPDVSLIVSYSRERKRVWSNLATSDFLFGKASMGEINFLAYDYPTFDYLNDLYGFITGRKSYGRSEEIERYLVDSGLTQKKIWKRSPSVQYPVTLATYIRHRGHHPENRLNSDYTLLELREAILDLRSLAKQANS